VFIIDDDAAIRDSCGFLLRSLAIDLAVESFPSASEFMDYLNTHEVPKTVCLIVDARMPEMSGVELMQNLIAEGKRFPFIMISGHGNDSLRQQSRELGAVAFLDKPFQPSLLKDAIDRAFGM